LFYLSILAGVYRKNDEMKVNNIISAEFVIKNWFLLMASSPYTGVLIYILPPPTGARHPGWEIWIRGWE
jgi:hypothetical protein